MKSKLIFVLLILIALAFKTTTSCATGEYLDASTGNCTNCSLQFSNCGACQYGSTLAPPASNDSNGVLLPSFKLYDQYSQNLTFVYTITYGQPNNTQNQGLVCTACSQGFGFSLQGSWCEQCSLNDSNCETCQGSLCLKCMSGYYLSFDNTTYQSVCLPCSGLDASCTLCEVDYLGYLSQFRFSDYYNLVSQSYYQRQNSYYSYYYTYSYSYTLSISFNSSDYAANAPKICTSCGTNQIWSQSTQTCSACDVSITGCITCQVSQVTPSPKTYDFTPQSLVYDTTTGFGNISYNVQPQNRIYKNYFATCTYCASGAKYNSLLNKCLSCQVDHCTLCDLQDVCLRCDTGYHLAINSSNFIKCVQNDQFCPNAYLDFSGIGNNYYQVYNYVYSNSDPIYTLYNQVQQQYYTNFYSQYNYGQNTTSNANNAPTFQADTIQYVYIPQVLNSTLIYCGSAPTCNQGEYYSYVNRACQTCTLANCSQCREADSPYYPSMVQVGSFNPTTKNMTIKAGGNPYVIPNVTSPSQVICDSCDSGFFYNTTQAQCIACTLTDTNCQSCYLNVCFQCKQGYYISYDSVNNTLKCQQCSSLIPGCTFCESDIPTYLDTFQSSDNQQIGNLTNPPYSYYYTCDPICHGPLNSFTQPTTQVQYQIPVLNLQNKTRIYCLDCGQGKIFNVGTGKCDLCNKTISGCGQTCTTATKYSENRNWNNLNDTAQLNPFYNMTLNSSSQSQSSQSSRNETNETIYTVGGTYWQYYSYPHQFYPGPDNQLLGYFAYGIPTTVTKYDVVSGDITLTFNAQKQGSLGQFGQEVCTNCAQGSFYNPYSNQCTQCNVKNCVSCIFTNFCQKCSLGYYISIDKSNNVICQKCPATNVLCTLETSNFYYNTLYQNLWQYFSANYYSPQDPKSVVFNIKDLLSQSQLIDNGVPQCSSGFWDFTRVQCGVCNITNCSKCVDAQDPFNFQDNMIVRFNATTKNLTFQAFGAGQTSGIICKQCANGTWFNNITSTCQQCALQDPNCQQCYGSFCMQCNQGYYIYYNTTLNSFKCRPCALLTPNCTKCEDDFQAYVQKKFPAQYKQIQINNQLLSSYYTGNCSNNQQNNGDNSNNIPNNTYNGSNNNSSNPNMTSPNMTNPNMTNPNMTDPNMTNPNMTNPNMTNPNMTNPNMTNPNMTNPNMTNPNMTNPNMTNPNMTNPNMTNPNMTNPNMTNPNMSDPNMTNPNYTYPNGTIDNSSTGNYNNSNNTNNQYQPPTVSICTQQTLVLPLVQITFSALDYQTNQQVFCQDCGDWQQIYNLKTKQCDSCSSAISNCSYCQYSQMDYSQQSQSSSNNQNMRFFYDSTSGNITLQLNPPKKNAYGYNGNLGYQYCYACPIGTQFNPYTDSCQSVQCSVNNCAQCSENDANSCFNCNPGFTNTVNSATGALECKPCPQNCPNCGYLSDYYFAFFLPAAVPYTGQNSAILPPLNVSFSAQHYLNNAKFACDLQSTQNSNNQQTQSSGGSGANVNSLCGASSYYDKSQLQCVACSLNITNCYSCHDTTGFLFSKTDNIAIQYNSTASSKATATFGVKLSNPIVCDICATGYGFNAVTGKCDVCTVTDTNCVSCQGSFCLECVYGYVPQLNSSDGTTYCAKCTDLIPGCQYCDLDIISFLSTVSDKTLQKLVNPNVAGSSSFSFDIKSFFQKSTPFCKNCTSTKYYNPNTKTCTDQCDAAISGCTNCTFKQVYDSAPIFVYEQTSKSVNVTFERDSLLYKGSNQTQQFCNNCSNNQWFNPTSSKCEARCSSIDPNCQKCSSGFCFMCNDKYVLGLNTTTGKVGCVLCTSIDSGCDTCGYDQQSWWLDNYPQTAGCFGNSTQPCVGGVTYNVSVSNYLSPNYFQCYSCTQGNIYTPATFKCSSQKVQCDYYSINQDNICVQCSTLITGCASCYENELKTVSCNYCNYGYLMFQGQCVLNTCTWSQYFDQLTGVCVDCSQTIANCSGCYAYLQDSTTQVVRCSWCSNGGNVQNDGTCSPCAWNQYQDNSTGNCVDCSSSYTGCYQCDRQNDRCVYCQWGYYLDNTQCVSCNTTIPHCTGGCGSSYGNQGDFPKISYTQSTAQAVVTWNSNDTTNSYTPVQYSGPTGSFYSYYGYGPLYCWWCDNGFTYSYWTSQCVNCSVIDPQCSSCQGSFCTNCQYGYYISINATTNATICVPCKSKMSTCADCDPDLDQYVKVNFPTVYQNIYTINQNFLWYTKGIFDYQYFYNYGQQNANSPISITLNVKQALSNAKLLCLQCVDYTNFYNSNISQCVACSTVVDACTGCYTYNSISYNYNTASQDPKNSSSTPAYTKYQVFQCYSCKLGYTYSWSQQKCINCNDVFPGCRDCYEQVNYNYNYNTYTYNYTYSYYCWTCLQGYGMTYDIYNLPTCKKANCDANCALCTLSGTQSVCQICNPNYELNCDTGVCSKQQTFCAIGQYSTICNQTCTNCSSTINNCFDCDFNVTGFYPQLQCTWCNHGFQPDYWGYCQANATAKKCPDGCTDCTLDVGNIQCTACNQTLFYFLDQAQTSCLLDCGAASLVGCISCSYAIVDRNSNRTELLCDVCAKGYYYVSGQCQSPKSCPQGSVWDYIQYQCINCGLNCTGCISSEKTNTTSNNIYIQPVCKICSPGFVLNAAGVCIASANAPNPCGTGCTSDCIWDQTYNYIRCNVCNSAQNYYKVVNQVDNTTSCQLNCTKLTNDTNCATCTQTITLSVVKGVCTDCAPGFIKSTTTGKCIVLPTCSSSQFYNPNLSPATGTPFGCQNCPTNCLACTFNSQVSSINCQYCNATAGLVLNDLGKCIVGDTTSPCPDGFYLQTSPSQLCVVCPSNCQSCTSSTNCNNCNPGYIQNPQTKAPYCLKGDNCVTGQYQPIGQQYCKDCSLQFCQACAQDQIDQSLKCIQCIDQTYYLNKATGVCYSTVCQLSQYFSISALSCAYCPYNCQACAPDISGKVQCSKCVTNFAWNATSSKCEFDSTSCSSNTASTGTQCAPCPPHCTSCSYAMTNNQSIFTCGGCESGYSKPAGGKFCYNTTCTATTGMYYGNQLDQSRGVNVEGCYSCTLFGCSACIFDYNLQSQFCTNCQTGYTVNATTGTCKANANTQVICTSGQVKANVSGEVKCLACGTGCAKCRYDTSKQAISCVTCSTNYKSSGKLGCVPDPNGDWPGSKSCTSSQYYSYDSQTCVACLEGCSACSQNTWSAAPYIYCSTCSTGYSGQLGRCLKKCSQDQYPVIDSTTNMQTCVDCGGNCINCNLDFTSGQGVKVCLKCSNGYYLSQQQCVQVADCAANQYYTLTKLSKGNFQQNCNDCPASCDGCSVTDPTNLQESPSCIDCQTNYLMSPDDYGTCLPAYLLQTPNCLSTGQYAYVDATLNWACADCADNCNDCDGQVDDQGTFQQQNCYDCKTVFSEKINDYVDQQVVTYSYDTGFYSCVDIITCDIGNFASISDYDTYTTACYPCDQNCLNCIQQNIYDFTTYQCLECQSGYVLQGKQICAVDYTGLTVDINTLCASNQFAYLDPSTNFVSCYACSDFCATCHWDNTVGEICDVCQGTFTLDSASGSCLSPCGSGYFQDESETCQVCDPSCLNCGQSSNMDCLPIGTCNSFFGYTYDSTSGACIFPNVISTDCGVGGYLGPNGCQCSDISQYFDGESCVAQDTTVPQGQYRKLSDGSLDNCAYLGTIQVCNVCTGPKLSDCQQCVNGYYLSQAQSQCVKCQENCQQCSDGLTCDKCSPGYEYLTQSNGQITFSCVATCPSGTLPNVASLYILNDQYTEDDYQNAYQSTPDPDFTTFETIEEAAIAIGLKQEPIFDSSLLPYEIDESSGIPYDQYTGDQVLLFCQPCIFNCFGLCDQGWLWVQNTQQCIYDTVCPDGYVMSVNPTTNQQQCDKPLPTVFAINSITQLSLDIATGQQSKDKAYVAYIGTTADDPTTVTCNWVLTGISTYSVDKKTGLASVSNNISNNQFIKKANNFFSPQSLATNCQFNIPSENLDKNTVYNLTLTATQTLNGQTQTSSYSVSFTVVAFKAQRDLSELGITSSQFSVVTKPDSGTGENQFTSSYTFDQLPTFRKNYLDGFNWTMSIQVGKDLSFASNNLIYSTDFTITPKKSGNKTVTITFFVNRGDVTWQSSTQVVVPPKSDYNISNSGVAQKVQQQSISADEASQLGSMISSAASSSITCSVLITDLSILSTTGPCSSTGSTSQCCGNGVCALGSTTKFICTCNSGYSGKQCEMNSTDSNTLNDLGKLGLAALPNGTNLTTSQQSQVATYCQNFISTGTADADSTTQCQNKLSDVATSMTSKGGVDKTTAQNVISATQQVSTTQKLLASSRRILLTDSQTAAYNNDQTTIKTYTSYFCATLKPTSGLSQTYMPAPSAQNQNPSPPNSHAKLLGSSTTSNVALSVASNTAGKQATVSISPFAANLAGANSIPFMIQRLTPVQNSQSTVNAYSYEVGIYTQSCQSASLNNPNNQILANITFQVQDKGSSNFTCVYFDTTSKDWQTNGVSQIGTATLSGGVYQVTCQTTHFSTFSVTYGSYTPPPPQTPPTDPPKNIKSSDISILLLSLQLLAVLMTLFVLA